MGVFQGHIVLGDLGLALALLRPEPKPIGEYLPTGRSAAMYAVWVLFAKWRATPRAMHSTDIPTLLRRALATQRCKFGRRVASGRISEPLDRDYWVACSLLSLIKFRGGRMGDFVCSVVFVRHSHS